MPSEQKMIIGFHPVQAISSLFRLRRDLSSLIKKSVLKDSNLTFDQADILIDLYGARRLQWSTPPADTEGYVSFGDLKVSLVHTSATLTRRLDELKAAGLVEVRPAASIAGARKTMDKKRKAARITKEGERKAGPVWEKYLRLCLNLMQGFEPEDPIRMWQMNEALRKKVRWEL
jgi:DNA-binding MarR family transcriptional regulator